MLPGREHWWWWKTHLSRALDENRQLDHFFFWKAKGRKSPDGAQWTPAQRRAIETTLWLYELDARVSHKYLFGKPAHLLTAEQLSSVIALAKPMDVEAQTLRTGGRRQPFAWEWIEFLEKRNQSPASKLTRAELNGIIAAMKYCLEYFLHE